MFIMTSTKLHGGGKSLRHSSLSEEQTVWKDSFAQVSQYRAWTEDLPCPEYQAQEHMLLFRRDYEPSVICINRAPVLPKSLLGFQRPTATFPTVIVGMLPKKSSFAAELRRGINALHKYYVSLCLWLR